MRTCALIGLIPKMFHSVIDLFHLQRVVFHDRAWDGRSASLTRDRLNRTYLSRALAYFSRSLFAISEICEGRSASRTGQLRRANYLDLNELLRVRFVNVFELFEVVLQCGPLVPETAQHSG